MAAGVSLRSERFEEFQTRINENCKLTEADLVRKVRIDMRLPLSYVTEDFVESLHILEPFGTGNPSPLFAQSGLKVLQMRVLGQKRNAVRLLLEDEGTRMDAVWFGSADDMEDYIRTVSGEDTLARLRLGMENRLRLAVTYHPEINEFRGVRNVQIRIVNYR
jgi:single-stranded-DNA-specific exonuclease